MLHILPGLGLIRVQHVRTHMAQICQGHLISDHTAAQDWLGPLFPFSILQSSKVATSTSRSAAKNNVLCAGFDLATSIKGTNLHANSDKEFLCFGLHF
jgi:hypothetical protein